MATEQHTSPSVDEGTSSLEWASWIAAILGLWTLVSPFVLSGEIASGTPMYSNIVAGVVILALGGYVGYTIRSSVDEWARSSVEWASWITALAGIWILVSPFVLSGDVTSGTPMYSTVVAGLVALVLAGYTGWVFHER